MSSVIPPAGLDDPAATGAPPADPPIGGPPLAGVPPAEIPAAIIAPVEFAFTPAQVVRDLYDFKTAKDAKLYKSATDPLPVKHNGTIETLRPMLDELLKKVTDYGWEPLITIPDDHGKTFNLILQNRALSFENVSNAATNYVGKQTRASQDNYLFATCILASLDTEGSQALRNSQYSYIKDGHICAALLIKVPLLDCEVETASTNFFVRAQLGNLEQFMMSVDYNIMEFNKHVSELLRKLRQGGEETQDDVLFIYMHVMRAYLICPDTDFLLVIKLQKIKAESDSTLLKLPTLMIAAQKAYQTLLQEGTYNVPQNQDTRLLALAAKYNPTTKAESHKPKGRNARDRGPKPAWMSIAPTASESKMKVVDGRTYLFCSFHKKWGQHKEVDCFVRRRQQPDHSAAPSIQASSASVSSASVSSESSSRLTMSAALATILDEDDDPSEYSAFPTVVDVTSTDFDIQPTSAYAAFDSDSFTILVDNGASRCMTNNLKHFLGTLTRVDKQVKGLGSSNVTYEGTHLATETNDHAPSPNGTWLATFADSMALYWNQQQHKRTIRFSSQNAFVGIMRSAPGFTRSSKFLTNCALAIPSAPLCFPSKLYHAFPSNHVERPSIPSDFDEVADDEDWLLQSTQTRTDPLRFDFHPDKAGEPPSLDTTATSDLSNLDTIDSDEQLLIGDEDDTKHDKNKHDLLTLHHRLGHMPFHAIRKMLTMNPTFHRLTTCVIPICSACLFAKATKRSWRTKASAHSLSKATAPGQIISVDQL